MVVEAEDYLSKFDETVLREHVDGLSKPRECSSSGVLTRK